MSNCIVNQFCEAIVNSPGTKYEITIVEENSLKTKDGEVVHPEFTRHKWPLEDVDADLATIYTAALRAAGECKEI